MPLGPGARLGLYEVLAALAASEMGEVYRGREPSPREIAIEVLPAEVVGDEEMFAGPGRLAPEARAW